MCEMNNWKRVWNASDVSPVEKTSQDLYSVSVSFSFHFIYDMTTDGTKLDRDHVPASLIPIQTCLSGYKKKETEGKNGQNPL